MSHTDRVTLLMALTAMPDPDDMLSWRVCDRCLEPDELRLLTGLTMQDAEDVAGLFRLEVELGGRL